MASLKATLCAGVIALGAADLAQAADLLPPPPPPPEPVAFGNWYIRGDVGVGISNLSSPRSTLNPFNPAGGPAPVIARVGTNIGDAAIAGVGFGYQFNNWIRFDATGEYRTSAAYRAVNTYTAFCTGANFCQDSYTANVASGVFLANAYIDIGTWYGVTPFVGAGVGGAIHKFSGLTDIGLGSGFSSDRNINTLAWAAMAGLDFNITPNLKLEISYRYLDMGKLTSGPISCGALGGCFFERQSFNLASNDVRIGFRYMFADPGRPVPPLIAKY
ncbi:outer membrane protein [Methyloferula stellata]|uniref:outer membrane protein n=1 Tax=Methyloferula stellata TaxID=876270 RepID=UPI0003A057F6|nr:outer membrane beta-barrel protein [Methyloferula stellata]